MLATIGLLGAFIGALLWGTLSDYIGRKTSFQATVGIFAIFTGLMSASWSVASLAVTRFFANIGLGGEQPVTSTLFTEYMPSKVRGKASGNMLAAFPAGMVVAALIGLLVVPTLGWRVLFIIGVTPAILIFFIRRSEPEALPATVNGLIPPYEHLHGRGGSMNRNPANQVMPGFIRLVPGAGHDAPAAAGRPFLPVGCPESQTAFGIDIPFAVTRIVV